MKVDENTKLKREQIEINIVEMFKYVCVRSLWVLLFAIVIAILIPLLKYAGDKRETTNIQSTSEEEMQEEEQLQNYMDNLEFYENVYQTEMNYRKNSILMKLDYKNINVGIIQFYVNANDEDLLDVMTAYSNYGNDGALLSDIYKLDNTVGETYLKEIIKLTCSNYSNYETSSVISVRVYAESEEDCSHYTQLVIQRLEEYSDLLNDVGIQNELNQFYEKYYIGQDSAVWTTQKNHNTTVKELENNITSIKNNIDMLKSQMDVQADGSEKLASSVSFSIKYAIVGFALGLILAIIFFVIKYIISGKLKYPGELNEATGILYIGKIHGNIRNISEKIFGDILFKDRFALVREESMIYKIKSLCEHYKTTEVTVIGDKKAMDEEGLNELTARLKKENVVMKMTGDVVSDITAMKSLTTDESVVIAIKSGSTSYAYVEELVKLCAIKKSNIIGYIYID